MLDAIRGNEKIWGVEGGRPGPKSLQTESEFDPKDSLEDELHELLKEAGARSNNVNGEGRDQTRMQNPVGARDHLQKLEDELRDASKPRFNSPGGHYYVPLDELQNTVCPEKTQKALELIPTDMSAQKLSSMIHSFELPGRSMVTVSFRKVFAILILIRKPALIEKFVVNNMHDDRLPIKRDHQYEHARRFSGNVLDRHDRLVECFQHWEPGDKEDFEKTQWELLAPSFKESRDSAEVIHYPLRSQQPLPFEIISDAKAHGISNRPTDPISGQSDEGMFGGSGKVTRIRIQRAHHTIPSYTVSLLFPSSVSHAS